MKKIKYLLIALIFLPVAACNDWVTDLPLTNDLVVESEMNKEVNVNFMITGLHNRLSRQDLTLVATDGLSDQFYFDMRAGNSTYLSMSEVDQAVNILLDNAESNGAYSAMHLMRMNSDTLVGRCLYKISFADNAIKNNGLFWGYFYGGLSRYYLAAYFGKDKQLYGATINGSAFLSAANLNAEAIIKLTEALKYTTNAYNIKLTKSIIARIYFMQGNYQAALPFLNTGLVSGDVPFTANYSTDRDNGYRTQAGEIRQQWTVDNRFAAYIAANAQEANRLPMLKLTNTKVTPNFTYYRQDRYKQLSSGAIAPIVIIDWQEVNLMKAECSLRGVSAGDALSLISAVRVSHNMNAINAGTQVTLETAGTLNIYEERDKELWLRGNRLLDQRRFNKPHIVGMWMCLPLSLNEWNKNPNLQ